MAYIYDSMKRAARRAEPAKTPDLSQAPARLYGRIEPLGREIYVGPTVARRVVEIHVKEGQHVRAGEVLCRLDDDIESQTVKVAEARVAEAIAQAEITRDELNRKQQLVRDGKISQLEFSQIDLRFRYEESRVQSLLAELEARRTEWEKLTLRAPCDGLVYTFDVRVGEQLAPEDYRRIVLGSPEKQVRLFVETFWRDRVTVGQRFVVKDRETFEVLGEGVVEEVSPYVGSRDFRTEDPLERLDTKFGQAVVRLESLKKPVPIGLVVLCERQLSGRAN
ncbi:MAG: efflux RND transporter periplasmic adaptor subunit [Candidatus Sumerlaeaceae bacterium]